MHIEEAVSSFPFPFILGKDLFPCKNFKFLSLNSFVFLSPFIVEYSHERIPKKSAPTISSPMAISFGVIRFCQILLKTRRGRHFWWATAPSSFEYPRSCRWIANALFPEVSTVGSSRRCDRKVAHIRLMVEVTVPPLRWDLSCLPCSFLLRDAMNADTTVIFVAFVNPSRN